MRDITPPSEDPIDFGSETSDEESDDEPTETINDQTEHTVLGVQPPPDTPIPSSGSMEQVI
jgi:hypothetical protein